MSQILTTHAFGTTEEFGIAGIDGDITPVLSFDKLASNESVTLLPDTDEPITEWVLGMDIYIPSQSGTYTGLLQTGGGDADLFLKKSGATAALGISSVYQGSVAYDTWVRLVVSVTIEDGNTILRKFVDGELVGTQNLGVTDRWAIDPDIGLRLFTDDGNETSAGYISSLFFMADPPSAEEVAALVAANPDPSVDGFFAQSPAEGSIEVRFDETDLSPTYGDATAILQGSGYHTVTEFGDSQIGYAAQFGIAAPGADTLVLRYSEFSATEGLHVMLPEGRGDLNSYTLVWDLMVEDIGGFQSLLQIDPENDSDGDFFINGSGGIGINANYKGSVPADAWVRIALTVEDLGNGSSLLSKYIDGALVGTQTMPTARFTLDADTGFLVLADNDGETGSGYLAHFGLKDSVLSAAEIADMGGVHADGPFAEAEGAGQLGFDGYEAGAEFGLGEVTLIEDMPEEFEVELIDMRDMLVTPDSEAVSYDLAEVFGIGAHDFSLTNSNGDAVEAKIEDGVLTLNFGDYGLSDLVVTAIGADGETLIDNIRIRVAGEGAYTIAIMPDTQDYTSNSAIAQTFIDMTTWMAENADNKGIGFVTHVGDLTQWASASQFAFAKEAMNILRDAGISYSVLPGNHDIGVGSDGSKVTATYNDAFSISYMSEDPTFGGVYDQEPERYDNNYHLWDAPDGTGWIFLNLEFGPRDDVLRWADEVLTQFGDRKAMITTHSYNSFAGRHDPLGGPLEGEGAGYNYGWGRDSEGAWDGEEIWREVISSHANVVFTAGGHIFGDGAETVVSYNDYGNAVYQFLVNYQNGVALESSQGGRGGNGAIRLVTVDPENDAVYTETYFTETGEYFTGVRGTEEESRNGLTGDYKGHQEEFYEANVGVREAQAEADAGDDMVVAADEGATEAIVRLSSEGSTDPKGDIVSWVWTDRDGMIVAEGAEAEVTLDAGVHDLTLAVTTREGVTSSDDLRIIVKTDAVHLVETFNDGDAAGWIRAEVASASSLAFGTAQFFGLPLVGDEDAAVMKVDALSPTEAVRVQPGLEGTVDSYTLIYDLYIPGGQGNWTALFQTDLGNTSDGEIFIRSNGDTGGVGISGTYQGQISYDAWNRVALTVSVEDGKQSLSKYVNGELVAVQQVDSDMSNGSRWSFDGEKGFLLFADESGETSDLYVSAFGFTPGAMSAEDIAAMGGVDGDGPLGAAPVDGAFQLNFDAGLASKDFGAAKVTEVDLAAGGDLGSFLVKGSATIEDSTVDAPQGALFDQSNGAENLVIWEGGDWDELTMEVTLRSMDNDTIGVAFNHAGGSTYLLTLDNQTNTRHLQRIDAAGTTVLASESGGYTFNIAQDLVVTKVGGRITATLDGQALFGGAVIDEAPLSGGTVGLYSSGQKSSIFDDVVVRAPELTAHAGSNQLVIDWDGDGRETVTLDGSASVLVSEDTDAEWSGYGVRADGLVAEVTLGAGRNDLTLTLNTSDGVPSGVERLKALLHNLAGGSDEGASSDKVRYDLATGERLIAADRFEDGDAAGWRIVDTTELGGRADWQVIDGALVETSGAYSRELTWSGANNSDVWDRGWSPLGDGVYALHKGSFALWEGNTELTDYAIRAEVTAPEGSVGLMLNYVDENNYYKIELDARVGLVSLVKVVDNYESTIARSAATYTPGESFTLEARIVGGKVSATMDGFDLFAEAVEMHDIESGAAGVWSWGAAGASFDDVAIVDLTEAFQYEVHGTTGNDVLVGTERDEVFFLGGGKLNVATGGAGSDTFVFGAGTSDGTHGTTRIWDFEAGVDTLDLGDAEINRVQESKVAVHLWVGEDNDHIILTGATSFDDLAFV
ncbi:hypothetical protein LCM08_24990 [Salipiger pacificus]|nr:hypothetical protein [Alloyangia pacifica]MCA0948198.1 hypothetical protein [Alloyangia pacifica]